MDGKVSEVIGPPPPQNVPKYLEKKHVNQSLRMIDFRGNAWVLSHHSKKLLKQLN